MADQEPENITLQQLRLLREDVAAMKDEITHKIGTMAETLIGVKRDISVLNSTVSHLETSVHGIKQDIATLAIAFDEHTHRLDRIEGLLPHHNA